MFTQTLQTKPKAKSKNATSISTQYQSDGYCLLRNAIPTEAIDQLLINYLALAQQMTGKQFADAHGVDLVEYYNANPKIESDIYGRIREMPWLMALAQHEAIVNAVKQVLGKSCGVFSKIPFRIDMPLWTQELALWHQDHFYVRGNTDIVTAWIPFQNTTYFNGCLSVMPGSHLLGPVPHDVKIGKKSVPSSVFGHEIRMVEMNKGDLLLFNSLLLHTGNMNFSDNIRYSLQPRFTPLNAAVDPGMGSVIAL